MEAEPSPARRPRGPERYVVGRPSDIPEGGSLLVTAGRREIGIYRVKGEFYALLNRCPHLGGPLCSGQVVTDIVSPKPGEVRANPGRTFVTCPWHNWEFDVRTGQSYWNPGLRALPFPVGIEGGAAVAAAVESGSAGRAAGRANGRDAGGRVAGPYTAETIPVSVEDDYLVVTLRPSLPQTGQAAPSARPAVPGATAAATEETS